MMVRLVALGLLAATIGWAYGCPCEPAAADARSASRAVASAQPMTQPEPAPVRVGNASVQDVR